MSPHPSMGSNLKPPDFNFLHFSCFFLRRKRDRHQKLISSSEASESARVSAKVGESEMFGLISSNFGFVLVGRETKNLGDKC